MGKFLDYDGLTYAINKIKTLINTKANLVHTHSATDINETANKNFVSSSEKSNLSKLNISGDGTKFLANDGSYKPANSSVIITNGDGNSFLANDGSYKAVQGGNANIDDKNISTTSTFSSSKIKSELDLKANVTQLHTHNNKSILDALTTEKYANWDEKTNMIVSTGDGNSYLTNNGTYKKIDGISSPIDDTNLSSTTTTLSASKITAQITDSKNDLNYNLTQQINKKVDSVAGKGLSTYDYNSTDKSKVDTLKINGVANKFHAEDGNYYTIDNVGINNENPSDITTFSGNEIKKRINQEITNLVLPTQNDAPTMWKKNFENVTSGQVLEMSTSLNFNINNAIIQVYKFVSGDSNVTKTISTFSSSDKNNYIYNTENIEFVDTNEGSVKIKDSYLIPMTLNTNGFYESAIISTGDYVDLQSFELT